jgi:hypothetical protein
VLQGTNANEGRLFEPSFFPSQVTAPQGNARRSSPPAVRRASTFRSRTFCVRHRSSPARRRSVPTCRRSSSFSPPS